MLKKSVIMCLVLLLAISSTVFATDVNKKAPKDIDLLESEITYDVPDYKGVVVEEFEPKGYDKEKKEIVDKDAFKESMLEYFNMNKEIHAESINNIDSIIDGIEANLSTKATDEIGIQSQVIREGWSITPYVKSSQNRVRYTEGWLVEDNYRSSVPITVSTTRTSTISQTIGYSGDASIRVKFGFSNTSSTTQTATVTHGAEVSAWTAWGTRPYIRFRIDNYYGQWYKTFFSQSTGMTTTRYYDRTGTNTVLRSRANEYWSRTNTTKNRSASTPRPPASAPQ